MLTSVPRWMTWPGGRRKKSADFAVLRCMVPNRRFCQRGRPTTWSRSMTSSAEKSPMPTSPARNAHRAVLPRSVRHASADSASTPPSPLLFAHQLCAATRRRLLADARCCPPLRGGLYIRPKQLRTHYPPGHEVAVWRMAPLRSPGDRGARQPDSSGGTA